jgi:hypothetical protein
MEHIEQQKLCTEVALKAQPTKYKKCEATEKLTEQKKKKKSFELERPPWSYARAK